MLIRGHDVFLREWRGFRRASLGRRVRMHALLQLTWDEAHSIAWLDILSWGRSGVRSYESATLGSEYSAVDALGFGYTGRYCLLWGIVKLSILNCMTCHAYIFRIYTRAKIARFFIYRFKTGLSFLCIAVVHQTSHS